MKRNPETHLKIVLICPTNGFASLQSPLSETGKGEFSLPPTKRMFLRKVLETKSKAPRIMNVLQMLFQDNNV